MKLKSGFLTCGPNEVLIVSGGCQSRPQLIRGGRLFVWPLIQKVQRLPLNIIPLSIISPDILAKQAVAITVTSAVAIKIDVQHNGKLRTACELFAGKSEKEIAKIATEIIDGHQRAVIGSHLIEEVYEDFDKFGKKILLACERDLIGMGLTVISVVVKDISDKNGYIEALRCKKIAELKRDTRVEEAESRRDSLIKEAIAVEVQVAKKNSINIEVAKLNRDLELQVSSNECDVQAKQAEIDMLTDLDRIKKMRILHETELENALIEADQKLAAQEELLIKQTAQFEQSVMSIIAEVDAFKRWNELTCDQTIKEAEAEASKIISNSEAMASNIEAKARAEVELVATLAGNHYVEKCIVIATADKEETFMPEAEQKNEERALIFKPCPDEMESDYCITNAPDVETKSIDNNNEGEETKEETKEEEKTEDESADSKTEELFETLSKVHMKVCEMTGVNLAGAILSAVFQEVLELLK